MDVPGIRIFGRNEPRDLYDVWYLTAVENMDLTALIPKVASKLEFIEN
jgi:predicted nucleotidyltransferase component of viral defense system